MLTLCFLVPLEIPRFAKRCSSNGPSSMPRSVEQLLRDVIEINGRVQEMTAGITLDQYSESRMLQLAVERSLEIVGEALRQLRDKDPELIARVDGYHSFVSLRHIIAHRYAVLEDE